ncbi:MAG: hypothetical protein ACPL7L_04135, partial [bacterium]
MSHFTLGNLKVSEKEKALGFLPVEGLEERFWPPVAVIRGKGLSPLVTVTGGVHGCEYSSIEACKQVLM